MISCVAQITGNRTFINGTVLSAASQALRASTLPQHGKFVLVQCRYFRCLGFFDKDSKWRNAQTFQELADVKSWCRIGEDTFIPVN